jgi:hypothetical protein
VYFGHGVLSSGNRSFCDTVCQVNRSRRVWESAQAKLASYKSTAINILYKCRSDVSSTALMSIDNLHFCGIELARLRDMLLDAPIVFVSRSASPHLKPPWASCRSQSGTKARFPYSLSLISHKFSMTPDHHLIGTTYATREENPASRFLQ